MKLYWIVYFWFHFLNSYKCQEGCRQAGLSSCCTAGDCQVPPDMGNCFCDQTCYSRRDCCPDIEFICPLTAGSGDTDASGDTEDIEEGSGNVGSSDSPTNSATAVSDRPPTFIRAPVNLYVINPAALERRLFISLTVDLGHPPGLLSWTHNGTVVSSRTDPRVAILSSGSLTIRNINFSDSGQYQLVVVNRAGNLTFDVVVKFSYLNLVHHYSIITHRNSRVNFVCSAQSYPLVYFRKWNASNEETLNSTREDLFNLAGGQKFIQVFLTNVDPLDCVRTGGYSCEFASGPTIYHNSVSAYIRCPIVPVLVSFVKTLYRVREDENTIEVCVNGTFDKDSVLSVSLTLSTALDDNQSSLAQYGIDYRLSLGTFTLTQSENTKCFEVTIVDDDLPEHEENFTLVLSADNALSNVSHPRTAMVIIQENDLNLAFEESVYEVSESIANRSLHLALQVCVTHSNPGLPRPAAGQFTLRFVTSSGTALGGIDYIPSNTRIDVDLGDSRLRVCECVNLLPDSYSEGEEMFQVSLLDANSGNIISTTQVKIMDDENVRVSIERSEYTATEDGTPFEVCVLLEGNLSTSVVLYLCTLNGTAKDQADYNGLTSHQIEFAPMNVSQQRYCRGISIIDDNIFEETEFFHLELMVGPRNNPGMVTVSPHATATVSILDNEVASATFVKGTPLVRGTNALINFVKTGSFASVECTLKGPGRSIPITLPCSSGNVLFTDVPLRYQEFSINVTGVTPEGTSLPLLQRYFRLDSPVCSVHLINDGVRTIHSDSVSIEWSATGPSSTFKVSRFLCMKDRTRTKFECTSPVIWRELSPGKHRLIVEPMPTPGCRRHLPQTFNFVL